MPSRIGAARAAVAVAAAAASFCALFALCGAVGADTQPAIVAAILAIAIALSVTAARREKLAAK